MTEYIRMRSYMPMNFLKVLNTVLRMDKDQIVFENNVEAAILKKDHVETCIKRYIKGVMMWNVDTAGNVYVREGLVNAYSLICEL